MIELKGIHNTALCFTDYLEPTAEAQIRQVCDTAAFAGAKIRIMPDVHAGMGCTIGTTMTIVDKVVPGMVGVDIGCGMEVIRLRERDLPFEKLDKLIREQIPSGREIRRDIHPFAANVPLDKLCCRKETNTVRALRSVGTLGGGNHFIEVDRDEAGNLWLVIHSGSRHIGNEVALYYQNEGYRQLCGNSKRQQQALVDTMRAEGREKEIQAALKKLKNSTEMRVQVPKNLAYVEGELFQEYLHDMEIIQHFASENRAAMADLILRGMHWHEEERFTTIHNYIDVEHMILRKGAVSAMAGEKLLIPISMAAGSYICRGKGNPDWNCSAPHGAGRRLSRTEAKNTLSMDEYRAKMAGIFTTCVSRETLDESPMAYKSAEEIGAAITPTAEILCHIHPIYNFKAAE